MSDGGSGRPQYVIGAYYRDLHQDSGRTITVADLFSVTAPLPPGASDPPVIQDTKVRFRESEVAAFGKLTYAVPPKVEVAAGARVFSCRRREASRRYGIPDVPPPYDRDRAVNPEVGARTSLWRRRPGYLNPMDLERPAQAAWHRVHRTGGNS